MNTHDMRLSTHFLLEEFEGSQTATRRGIDNRAPKEVVATLEQLCVQVLEPVRAHFMPVHITSGYRCLQLNQAIGGSAKSQHVQGQAADFVVPNISPLQICTWIAESEIVFDQLIYEGNWTHISWAKTPRRNILTAIFDDGRVHYEKGIVI